MRRCLGAKRAIIANHGKRTELTLAQWQFLRGVYVLNPNTPPGLPFGDKAVLVQVDGKAGGLVRFIDGEMACTPMPIPQPLPTIVQGVATAAVSHAEAVYSQSLAVLRHRELRRGLVSRL